MKKFILIALVSAFSFSQAQTKSELTKHYEAYYKQMKTQGDVQGVISALTHLSILEPKSTTIDTLAYLYMSNNKHAQALNTIGIDRKASDSDMAVEVKAVSLKALNQVDKAIPHFEELFRRAPNVVIAYELADLQVQANNLTEAMKHIDYGLTNSKDDIGITYYETQYPYQVKSKAAFTYQKGLVKFRENQETNMDLAISFFDQALVLEPNFNLAKISKEALLAQKEQKVKKN